MKSIREMQAEIAAKAAGDADFRERLRRDPKGTIEREWRITIPASMSIEVHEENAATAHLVLPFDGKLTMADLKTASGGWTVEYRGDRLREPGRDAE